MTTHHSNSFDESEMLEDFEEVQNLAQKIKRTKVIQFITLTKKQSKKECWETMKALVFYLHDILTDLLEDWSNIGQVKEVQFCCCECDDDDFANQEAVNQVLKLLSFIECTKIEFVKMEKRHSKNKRGLKNVVNIDFFFKIHLI